MNKETINFLELYILLKEKRILIFYSVIITSILSLLYSYSVPEIYKANAILIKESRQELPSVPSQLSNLASLGGVSLPGEGFSREKEAIEVIKSRNFLVEFNARRNIFPDLMAANSWNEETDIVYYEDFDPDTGEWTGNFRSGSNSPSILEAHEVFLSEYLEIEKDEVTGMIHLSIKHISPNIAKSWVDWIVQDINSYFAERDRQTALRSMAFLEARIVNTNQIELKKLLFELIAEEEKKLTLINSNDEYVLRVLDQAFLPETLYSPIRINFLFFGIILGLLLPISLIFLSYLKRKTGS